MHNVVPPTEAAAGAPEPAAAPSCVWTRQQDKLLELLVCRMYPRWDRIAPPLGDKTPCQARQRYESTVAELRRVLEAPRVETPPGWDLQGIAPALAGGGEAEATVGDDGAPPPADGEAAPMPATDCVTSKEAVNQRTIGKNQKKKAVPQKRNKAVPWSEVEHKLFLEGIRKHGTGGWKRLAREFVVTRTAGQIASHYQKYSIRQAKRRRNQCKRPSIHDIGDDGTTGAAAADHGSDQQPAAAAEGEPESGTTDDVSAGEEEAANYW